MKRETVSGAPRELYHDNSVWIEKKHYKKLQSCLDKAVLALEYYKEPNNYDVVVVGEMIKTAERTLDAIRRS